MDDGMKLRELQDALDAQPGQIQKITFPEMLTLRDRFACAALTGLLCSPKLHPAATAREIASEAYEFATAMLQAREGR